ncbi:hypothetical protein [Ruegeria atlantica]|uniref:hypothetical protein n=1 Tax=Ruegeria atlantica TaxID=81569 RepID=UPI00147C5ECF|nr:hypothetical protein [Ruegeria atlantica]
MALLVSSSELLAQQSVVDTEPAKKPAVTTQTFWTLPDNEYQGKINNAACCKICRSRDPQMMARLFT